MSYPARQLLVFFLMVYFLDIFKEKDPGNTNAATFSLEEWVERTLYS